MYPSEEANMVEPEANFGRAGRSDTYLGELVELNQSNIYISELDELSELSDTILDLNELSDTEEGAGLVAGRNGSFSAHQKIHKKFNLGRFYTKFDQALVMVFCPFASRNINKTSQGLGHIKGHSTTNLFLVKILSLCLCFLSF